MAPTMAKEKPGGSAHNAAVLDRLRSLRGPGESYTDVILRLASKRTIDAGQGRCHVWTTPADQGFFCRVARVVGAVMSPAWLCGDKMRLAGPDVVRVIPGPIKVSRSRTPRAWGWVRNLSHHVIVTLDFLSAATDSFMPEEG